MKAMKKWTLWIVVAVVAAVVAGWAGWRYVTSEYSGEPRWVYLPAGIDRAAVKDSLQATLGDFGSKVYNVYDRVAPDSVVARGAYRISSGERATDVAARLFHRRQTPVNVTFHNIRTMDQLAARVGDQLELSAPQFLAACDSVLPAAGFRRPEYIAAFFPDTYEFYWTVTPEDAVERLLSYRNRFWNDDRRARAAALGLNPVKVATVASIAEEETLSRTERATVARLYINRLRKGMKLQADPTVKFAVGDFGLRRITAAHLRTESPYNTYIHAGLPPGPIRMAERATVEATLESRPHDYLYMCAKEDFSGTHNFATDYATHSRNAARYRRALDRRGIR